MGVYKGIGGHVLFVHVGHNIDMLPWWFWFFPIGLVVFAVGFPLWINLYIRAKKKDPP